MTLLSVKDLRVTLGGLPLVKGVSFDLAKGEILGIVGESGSGKSMTAHALMRLLPDAARTEGEVHFQGNDILSLDEQAMCSVRGRRIAMVFQDPMTALNPLMSIGEQVLEGIRVHQRISRREAKDQAHLALKRVGLDPEQVSPDRFPHELSGGQRQRVVIAMAVAMRPELIIADEPTTALDVTTQAQILALLRDIVQLDGAGLLLISHDLSVISTMADRIAVMQAGTIVETGNVTGFAKKGRHPATQAMLKASTYHPEALKPQADDVCQFTPLLVVEDVVQRYPLPRYRLLSKRPYKYALNGVSLNLYAGEAVALIGESGSGKSTLSRLLLGLEAPDTGRVRYLGKSLVQAGGATLRAMRRDVQAVFQDPYSSLDPHKTAGWIVGEPLHMVPELQREAEEHIAAALSEVGLSPDDAKKYPHAFSGGQRQRLALARALITRPRFLILDEPVSSLDVSMQAQILDLLVELREKHALGYLFITHDLHVAEAMSQRIVVMQNGQIVEEGASSDIFRVPEHTYTRALLAATPNISRLIERQTF